MKFDHCLVVFILVSGLISQSNAATLNEVENELAKSTSINSSNNLNLESVAPHSDLPKSIESLLLAGKGIQALSKAEERIKQSNNSDQEFELIGIAIDLCLMMQDLDCFNRIYSKYRENLESNLDSYFKNQNSDKISDVGVQKFHRFSAYDELYNYYFADIAGSWDADIDNEVVGLGIQSKYAALHHLALAGRNNSKFKTKDAIQQLRIARALMVENDLNDLITQWHYAELLDLSAQMFNDLDDIRYFIEIKRSFKKIHNINISEKINPYALAIIYGSVLDSGLLTESEEIEIRSEISKIFDSIEIPKGSMLEYRKSSFYAYSILEKIIINKAVIDGNSIKQLEKVPVSNASLAAFALTSIIAGDKNNLNRSNLQTQINYLEGLKLNFKDDGISYLDFELSVSILKALACRFDEDSACEIKNLIHTAETYLRLRNKSADSINSGRKGIKTDRILSLYVINRFEELGYKSPVTDNYIYVVVNSIYELRNSELVISRSLSASFDDEMNSIASKQYVVARASYKESLYKSYYDFFNKSYAKSKISGNDSKTSREFIGPFITALSEMENNWLYISGRNILKVGSIEDLQKSIHPDELIMLSSYADGIQYVLFVSKIGASIKVNNSDNRYVNDLNNIIVSGDIHKIKAEEINSKLLYSSNALFGNTDFSKYKKVFMLTGPQVANIPYTLFKYKKGLNNRFIIEDASIIVFDTVKEYQVFRANKDDSSKFISPRSTNYLAFANPQFTQSSQSDEYALVIRGGSGASVSNLAMLPETQIEAVKFASNIPGKHKLLFGKSANTKEFYSQNYNDVEILTIATHAVMSGEVYEAISPSIVLTPYEDSGLIDVNSLFKTYGAPRLVILSTCNSARPELNINYSQISSLSNSYQMKGSESVIASLWQVDSISTQNLMINFSKYLSKGMDSPEAMRLAQIDMINSESSHPALWAAFIVSGVYEPKSLNNKKLQDDLIVQVIPNKRLISSAASGDYQYLSVYDNKDLKQALYSSMKNDKFEIISEGGYLLASNNHNSYYLKDMGKEIIVGMLNKSQLLELCKIDYLPKMPIEFAVMGDSIYLLYKIETEVTTNYILKVSLDNCVNTSQSNSQFALKNATSRLIKSRDGSRISVVSTIILDKPLKSVESTIGDIEFKISCGIVDFVNLSVFSNDLKPMGIYDLPGYAYHMQPDKYDDNITLYKGHNCLNLFSSLVNVNIQPLLDQVSKNNDVIQNIKTVEEASKIVNMQPIPSVFIEPVIGVKSDSNSKVLLFRTKQIYEMANKEDNKLSFTNFEELYFYSNESNSWITVNRSLCNFPVVVTGGNYTKALCSNHDGIEVISSKYFH